ncbi:PTS ascorbate transporter subunit IIC [Anaerococcus sp. Marseille-Q7828]|uniref:PTS ascorbate transporter subunit IIC n=1 Tax=Anaerococcus sp. Marseille-Q7828 TaxID=3036300 RepID=UPI0024AD0047|nr:PTS ascorbate transporter subunit IIC [Anaerococcus sp. Marseille-Q7828]
MNFITQNILRNPPVLLGLIALIGLLLQKKSASDIIKGSLMAAFGMIILDTGVGMLVGTISPINEAFSQAINGSVGEGLNDITFTANFGGEVGLAMFIGLVIHLLIAKFTPIKTIFLTGHMIWWFPFIFVAAGVEAGLKGTALIASAAILSALYWSIMPWVLRKYVFDVTGDESFTLGHPTGVLSLIAGSIARAVGDKSKSTEDIDFPKNLSFFREVPITGGIVMMLIWIIIGLIIPSLTENNLIFESLNQGLKFGAGLLIMLQGVRMLINQIVPAFQGISEKIVPNAIPAFDCPVIFNYKPNAVIIGFITSMVVSTVTLIVVNKLGIFHTFLLPLVITCFFECGAAAVIAEGQGGMKGCIIGTAVSSIVMIFVLGISADLYSNTISNWMLIFGGNDFSIFGSLAKLILSIFS